MRRVWPVALVGTSACFPSFDGLNAGPAVDSSAGLVDDAGREREAAQPDAAGEGATTESSDHAVDIVLPPDSPNLGEMHLYVNGLEEGTPRTLMQFRNAGDHYDFGYDAIRPTGGFQGVLDEVIVYDWVIPAAGVNKLAAPM